MGKVHISIKSGTIALVSTIIVGAAIVTGGSIVSSPFSNLANTLRTHGFTTTLTGSTTNNTGNILKPAAQATIPDTERPNGTVTAPVAHTIIHGTVTATIHATDNVAPTKVVFYLDPGSAHPIFGTSTDNHNGDFSVPFDTTKTSNGTHSVAAYVYDAAGNSHGTAWSTFTVDNQAPAVAITTPADNAVISSPTTATATASDNVAVAKVVFALDGKDVATDTSAPYSYSLDPSTLTAGAHQLTATATDTAGNTKTSSVVHFTVPDTERPHGTVTAPANNTTISGTVTVTIHGTDNVAPTKVVFYLDPGNHGSIFGTSTTNNNGDFSVPLDTTKIPNGVHYLAGITYDAAGNSRGSSSATVTVDNRDTTAPVVSITAPADNTTLNSTTTVKATATDNIGVTKVEFYADSTKLATDTSAPYEYALDPSTLSAGAHQLTTKAYDAAGNTTTSSVVHFTIPSADTERPHGTVTAPANNTTISGTVTVTIHGTDNVAPTKVVFYLDPGNHGSIFGTSTTNNNGDFSVPLDTTKIPNGVHYLAGITYDAAGNSRGSSSVTVTVDNHTATDPMSPFNLDETGKTIPDTNYTIPVGAIFMATTGSDSNAGTQAAPVKTLNRAVDMAPTNGTIVIRGGEYRDNYHWSDKPYYYKIITKKLTYQAYPHEQVWFDGTEVQATNSWTSDGNGHWYKSWSTPQFCDGGYYDFPYGNQSKAPNNLTGTSGKTYSSNTGPCAHWDVNSAPEYPAATDPQLAYIDGQRSQEVASLSSMHTGDFYYDWTNRRIYIPTNPSGHTVELATRPNAMVIGASGSQIKGLGFRRYASNEYSNLTGAAVYMGGTNFLVQDSVFTENAGSSVSMAPQGSTMNHVASVNNGYSSSGGNGHSEGGSADNVQILNSLISNNNTEHFDLHCSLSCGQAGMKMAHMKGFTVKGNIFKNNDGSGFWCDENCTGGVMVNNLFMNNTSSGVFYEISSDGIIASNVFVNNGPSGYGVRVAAATTKVYNNTIITNKAYGAIWVYDDDRNAGDTRGTQIGPNTTDVDIANNVIYNTNGTTSSLSAQGGTVGGGNTQPDQFFNTIDYNAYYRQQGTSTYALVRWLPRGVSETKWKTDAAFHAAKGFDQHGIDIVTGGDPFFTDLANGKYNIRSNSPAYKSGGAIPADVAAAIGVSTAAGQNRGALNWPGK